MSVYKYEVTIYVEAESPEQADKKAEYALNIACSEDHQEDTRLHSWCRLLNELDVKVK